MSRSAGALGGGVTRLFGGGKLDAKTLQELEDMLVASDLGVAVAARLVAELSAARLGKDVTPQQVREALAAGIARILSGAEKPLDVTAAKPFVILVVGVNGTGKTTTIGKIAHRLRGQGKSAVLAAGDTFRGGGYRSAESVGRAHGVRGGGQGPRSRFSRRGVRGCGGAPKQWERTWCWRTQQGVCKTKPI